jgi:hypothetical protein
VDALGLVNAGVAEHVAHGDFTWAYVTFRPEYLIINRLFPQFTAVTAPSWFLTEYKQVETLSEIGYPAPLIIYRRIDSTGQPPTKNP